MWSPDPSRVLVAVGALVCYAAICWRAWQRARAGRGAGPAIRPAGNDWTIVFASQSGSAEALARQAARALAGNASVACLSLERLDSRQLSVGGRFLFLVSTTGEGEAPDHARRFVDTLMRERYDLRGVEFAIVALGDSSYRQFCAFGRALEDWLLAQGARSSFARIEVDRLDPATLAVWRAHLAALAGADDLPGDDEVFLAHRLQEKRLLNPGSAGAPVFDLQFVPVERTPAWQAGDLALVRHPDDPLVRAYSIASVPTERAGLRLLVRRARRADGSPGLVSGWLADLPVGTQIPLAIRAHSSFRALADGPRPAIFIGNGVGLAGLRAHLVARIAAGLDDNWLLFGERHAACDHFWQEELEAWQTQGKLRLDAVFSRDGGRDRYVQDRLAAEAQRLLAWLERGAVIHVCGSRMGMGAAVDACLQQLLGAQALADLQLQGRYRRDVF